MKNPFRRFIHKDKKEKVEEKAYYLCCDFGYDITSPIPSIEPLHKNSHCCVPAVVGTTVKLFPGDSETGPEQRQPVSLPSQRESDD